MPRDFDDYENDLEKDDLPEENPREKGDDDGVEYGDPRDARDERDEDDDHEWRAFGPDYDYGDRDDIEFADPGGNSALRAAGPGNPRNLPCPTCEAPNRLTPADRARGYQCDACADRAERGGY